MANGSGVTFQQVQKYENGTNRVSASKLQAVAGILGIPIGSFFAADDGQFKNPGSNNDDDADDASQQAMRTFVRSAEGLQLNRAFARIKSAKTRRSLIALLKALG